MGVAISGLIFVVAATLAVYAADAIASSGRGRAWWRGIGVGLTIVMLTLGFILIGLAQFDDQSTMAAGLSLLMAGAVLGLILSRHGRAAISRLLSVDAGSPRDWLGLLAVLWFLIFSRLVFDLNGDAEVTAVTTNEAVIQMLLLIGVTSGVVGLFVRRDLRQTLKRLGITRPNPRAIAISVGAVIPFAMGTALTTLLVDYIQPGTLDRLEETVSGMTGGETSLQLGLILGITAAVGEESLFRGALLPKYGLIFTSLVFALLHAQYDLLLALGSLFPAGLILGLERKYLGTTTAVITHALYNLLSVIGSV